MKKTTIFSVIVVLIGIIASLGILKGMQKRSWEDEGVIAYDEMKHHQVNACRNCPSVTSPTTSPEPNDVLSIKGRVLDPLGNPVEGVRVTIAKAIGGIILETKTSADGYFSVNGIAAGIYEVSTNEENGPTCPACPFYSSAAPSPSITTVNAREGEVGPNLVLQTPPKLARIKGRILDAATNEPILTSRITLRRSDTPEYAMEIGPDEEGSFSIPIPTSAITIEVKAQGYQPWTYFNPNFPRGHQSAATLKLLARESLTIEIGLRKLPVKP